MEYQIQEPVCKVSGWRTLLHQYLVECEDCKFSYGEFNCVLFANTALYSMTGIDLFQNFIEFRGFDVDKFDSEESCVAFVKAYGGLEQVLYDAFEDIGVMPCPIETATLGDIILKKKPDTVGICLGEDSAFISHVGLSYIPTQTCHKTFKIN